MGLFGMGHFAAQESLSGAMASKDASRASNRAAQAERSVKMLEADLAKTLMICEALWELLSQRTGLTTADLHSKLYEIDMRDGVLDGKNQRKAVECPQCGRTVAGRHAACLYCGQVIDDSVFRL